MHKRFGALITTYRLVAVAAIVGAIVWQLVYSATHYTVFNVANFFSFFTIDSNIIAAAALLWAALAHVRSPRLDIVRGAATLYMVITGIVTVVLLRNIDVDLTLPAVDLILHTIIPIVMIADWLIDPPTTRFGVRQVGYWFAFPLAWLAYTLARGPLADWYPYPFLNPLNGGYGVVTAYCVGVVLAGVAVSAVLAWAGRMRAPQQ